MLTVTSSKLTSKGQLTLPKPIRERLGVGPGDELEFVEEGGVIFIRKEVRHSPFDQYVGFLSQAGGRDTDDIIRDLRGGE